MTDQYSFSLTTFDPNGKLHQIEHALATAKKGDSALGIKTKDGVVLACEKKVPSALMDETTFKKIENISSEVGCVYAGMSTDAKVLLRQGRKRAQAYKATFGDEIPCSQCIRELADIMQEFTQSGGVRPFGCSLMVAGYDAIRKEAQLYQVDPSGTYFGWKASAIGLNSQNMKTFLEKRYTEDGELEDAIQCAILTLKEGFEGEMTEENIEIGICRNDGKFEVLEPRAVRDYLQEVE